LEWSKHRYFGHQDLLPRLDLRTASLAMNSDDDVDDGDDGDDVDDVDDDDDDGSELTSRIYIAIV
jgi:hypothetical protein